MGVEWKEVCEKQKRLQRNLSKDCRYRNLFRQDNGRLAVYCGQEKRYQVPKDGKFNEIWPRAKSCYYWKTVPLSGDILSKLKKNELVLCTVGQRYAVCKKSMWGKLRVQYYLEPQGMAPTTDDLLKNPAAFSLSEKVQLRKRDFEKAFGRDYAKKYYTMSLGSYSSGADRYVITARTMVTESINQSEMRDWAANLISMRLTGFEGCVTPEALVGAPDHGYRLSLSNSDVRRAYCSRIKKNGRKDSVSEAWSCANEGFDRVRTVTVGMHDSTLIKSFFIFVTGERKAKVDVSSDLHWIEVHKFVQAVKIRDLCR